LYGGASTPPNAAGILAQAIRQIFGRGHEVFFSIWRACDAANAGRKRDLRHIAEARAGTIGGNVVERKAAAPRESSISL